MDDDTSRYYDQLAYYPRTKQIADQSDAVTAATNRVQSERRVMSVVRTGRMGRSPSKVRLARGLWYTMPRAQGTIILGFRQLFHIIQVSSAPTQSTRIQNSLRDERRQEILQDFKGKLDSLKMTDSNFSRGRRTQSSKWADKAAAATAKHEQRLTETIHEKTRKSNKEMLQHKKRQRDRSIANMFFAQSAVCAW